MCIISRCENMDAFKWLIIQIVSRCRAQYNVGYKWCSDSSLCGRSVTGRLGLQQCVSTYGESVGIRLSNTEKKWQWVSKGKFAWRPTWDHVSVCGLMIKLKEMLVFNNDESVCLFDRKWVGESTSLLPAACYINYICQQWYTYTHTHTHA